jgi:hypothetical protein
MRPLTYQGKPIESWFAQLPVTHSSVGSSSRQRKRLYQVNRPTVGNNNVTDDSAIDAITALGTNALLFLIAKLQSLDSILERGAAKAATNAGVGYLPFRNADLERLQAVTGLIHLKTLTPEAKQSIESLRTNANSNIASAAAHVTALGEPQRP